MTNPSSVSEGKAPGIDRSGLSFTPFNNGDVSSMRASRSDKEGIKEYIIYTLQLIGTIPLNTRKQIYFLSGVAIRYSCVVL
jgi:hypothetical protein